MSALYTRHPLEPNTRATAEEVNAELIKVKIAFDQIQAMIDAISIGEGLPSYTWIAYADSIDGTANFTTGSPGNRSYIGIAHNKAVPLPSMFPEDYQWSRYASLTGPQGDVSQFIWKRAASQPATPEGDNIPAGWSDEPPAGSDVLWMSMALQRPDGTAVGPWSTPVRTTGDSGEQGEPAIGFIQDSSPGPGAFISQTWYRPGFKQWYRWDGATWVRILGNMSALDLIADTAYIANGLIVNAHIADANITTAKIADGNITSAKVADANITTAKIADANVSNAKIGTAAVTNAKIQNLEVDAAKIANLTVGNSKIADDAVSGGGGGASLSGTLSGNGSYQTALTYSFNLQSPGKIILLVGLAQGYVSGNPQWQAKIIFDGTAVSIRGGTEKNDAPVLVALQQAVPAGSHTVELAWYGASSGIQLTGGTTLAVIPLMK